MIAILKCLETNGRAILPAKATEGSACFDLFATIDVEIKAGKVGIYSTGLKFEVPEGYVMMIYSRSGQGFKNKVTLVNGTGVIDSDYRGEVKIGLRNDGDETYFQPYGKAIAQFMLVKLPYVVTELVDALSDTDRGEGGFGHSDDFKLE